LPNTYPTYHASELKAFLLNNATLFPSHEYTQPLPIVTDDSLKEFLVEEIIDARCRGKGWQYLVQWVGYSPEHNRWLSGSALHDCEVLDVWLGEGKVGAATQ